MLGKKPAGGEALGMPVDAGLFSQFDDTGWTYAGVSGVSLGAAFIGMSQHR